MINAVNAKRSGLSSTASMQEIAAYITANWTGGSSNGNISYIRHYHSSSCYIPCPGIMVDDGDGRSLCEYCRRKDDIKWNGTKCAEQGTKVLGCGYSNGQIISATITY